ncbi:MAG: sulfatase-like hydrolase/transferase, partial [Leptolyngbya sp. SIO3F4]|nr:sulfatase-like hydrolase/transferase [Leptolyngbya sp. SIO3F4]
PFFLAVGILKPHLPFNAPQKYWDMYERADFNLPKNYAAPENAPKEALFNWEELRAYEGVPANGPVSDSMAIDLIHGYYASVSYADALVGKMLTALDEFGLAENTIVVLWSDHGYFLGEHSFWTKHALFELSTNVPLIIRNPVAEKAMTSNALVDLVDVYPTLCDLANLEKPTHLQGKSFHTLFDNPKASHRQFSYTRYKDGESIKDAGFRYTQYLDSTGMIQSEMLYNHLTDPSENKSIAIENEYNDQKEGLKNGLEAVKKSISEIR